VSNAFNADFGTQQGRVANAAAPLDAFYFQLGSEARYTLWPYNPGDHHRVAQSENFTGVATVRCSAVLRGVADMPAGAAWELRVLFDGVIVTRRTIDDRDRVLSDLVVNLALNAAGTHELAYELGIAGGTGPYEVDLPGCAIDAIVIDGLGQPLEVMNRNPEPGEVDIPLAGPLMFDLECTSSVGSPDTTRTQVYVDAVLVYLNGTFQTGWTGSSIATTVTGGRHFVLVPTVPLTSSAAHVVRVVSTVAAAEPGIVDTSWSITTEDLIAPTVVSAFVATEDTVRITYSESVRQAVASAEDDALNPTNYTVVLVSGAPAVTPTVVSVSTVTSLSVLLTFDMPMTPRAIYRVTVLGVEDLPGNVIVAPLNTALFDGFICPGPAGRMNFYELMPLLNRQEDEGDLANLCAVFQEIDDLLLCLADRWPLILDPDFAPEVWVDLMLVDQGNPFRFEMTLLEKRRLVQLLPVINAQKGTGPGIINAIRLFMDFNVTINVFAWSPVPLGDAILGDDFILGSSDMEDLLTFEVHVPVALTDEGRRRILEIVQYVKDAREFFLIVEPTPPPPVIDHWSLGYSLLGTETTLH
jgi:phage tail-like protein